MEIMMPYIFAFGLVIFTLIIILIQSILKLKKIKARVKY